VVTNFLLERPTMYLAGETCALLCEDPLDPGGVDGDGDELLLRSEAGEATSSRPPEVLGVGVTRSPLEEAVDKALRREP